MYKNYSVKSNPSKKVDQKKIDEILDKISKSGYDSLSQSEKETLFKAGDNWKNSFQRKVYLKNLCFFSIM